MGDYSCPRCERWFGDHVALMQHAENSRCAHGAAGVHRGVRMWESSRNQRVFTNGAQNFSQMWADDDAYDDYREEWVCSVCDRGFYGRNQLNQHLRSGTHDRGNYRCTTCGQTFGRMSQIVQHQAHGGCGAGPARLGRLIAHDYSTAGPLMLTNGNATARAEATLNFDGGARPNPGRGGAGYIIYDLDDYFIQEGAVLVTSFGLVTSNQAEYVGLIIGLQAALDNGIRRLTVQGDSQLVIYQMTGSYAVRSDDLRNLYHKACNLANKFQSISYYHIYRRENTEADAAASRAICGLHDDTCHLHSPFILNP